MTLGGIAVAMGELVDDAIVDVENIFRRLSENNALPNPKPALLVVYEASREIRSAIVFGTAVVILAFLPLFALSGVEGRLFTPLGIAYIVSILASLAGVADRHAGAVVLPAAAVESHASPSRRPAAARAEVGGELSDPLQHALCRHAAARDLGARRLQRLAADATGRRLPAEVRRGQRADQRRPAGRLVAQGIERGVGRHRSQARRRCRRRRRIPTGPSCTSPAAPAGPNWTNTPSRSTSANTS